MVLTDLTLQTDYDRHTCPNIVDELYAPVSTQADKCDCMTFTFSRGGLAFAARGPGLESFVERNGDIRLICDRSIDCHMLEAIKAGGRRAANVLREQTSPNELTAKSGGAIVGHVAVEVQTQCSPNCSAEMSFA